MSHRSSFSQHNTFNQCKRWWFYLKVLKIPAVSDMSYAKGGSIVHKVLQKYYDGDFKDNDEAKEFFNQKWENERLPKSIIKNKKDSYFLMCLNGIQLNKKITTTELKIFYPDVVAYLDGVNTEDDEILDWKSSTRSKENEEEYTKQLELYAWLYSKKFNRIPKKCTVQYLKYSGSKGELSITPDNATVMDAEENYYNVLKQMEEVIAKNVLPQRAKECGFFCPYKDLCFQKEDELNIKLYLQPNSSIYVEGNISPLLNKGLFNKFSYELKDAFFIKKHNPFIPTKVEFWKPNKRILPIGFLSGLKKTLNDYAVHKKLKLNLEIKDKRVFDETNIEMPDKFINDVKLRDYQNEAVKEFIKHKIGILEVGTGGGKTEISIDIIRMLKMKTLFIVDKVELLRQTKKRIESSLGIKVGQIGAGEEDIQDITVATIQTLNKNVTKYAEYLKGIRFVIFDETHKAAAKSYWKLSQYLLNTEYRLGMSGTAFRDDGNDMMINAVAGYKIFDLSSKVLIDKGWLIKPKIVFIKDYMSKEEVKKLEEETKTGLINETMDYANYYESFIYRNPKRNAKILETFVNNKGKKILILTKLVDHGKLLNGMIRNSRHLYGSTPKDEREEIMKDFTTGKITTLISTISIFSEGIDIPSLDIVINAAANKGNVKTIQILGRILRKLEGKKEAVYYDFIDETKFFKLASYARKRILVKEGHEVEFEK